MAVPKSKVSKARRDKRRSSVWKLDAPGMVECPQCHELKLPHRVCPSCGYYNGKAVIKDEKEASAAKPAKETAEAAEKAPAKKTASAAKKTSAAKKAAPEKADEE